MWSRLLGLCLVALCSFPARIAHAQWTDPRLILGQVGFNVTVGFVGKVFFQHQSPGRALKKALVEGATSGLVAHTGYCVAGRHPHLALVGKTLAQKSSLMTRRSIRGEPVFDRSLYSHWQITHSFLHFQWKGTPRVELDVLNSAMATYFLFSQELQLDPARSLYSGSLFFRNDNAPPGLRGYSVPGVIWVSSSYYDDPSVFGHELIHTLQNERGSAIADWHYKGLRFNLLAFAPGVPSLLEGWPRQDKRIHEREADLYAGRK
jgi:hypothetical protein